MRARLLILGVSHVIVRLIQQVLLVVAALLMLTPRAVVVPVMAVGIARVHVVQAVQERGVAGLVVGRWFG